MAFMPRLPIGWNSCWTEVIPPPFCILHKSRSARKEKISDAGYFKRLSQWIINDLHKILASRAVALDNLPTPPGLLITLDCITPRPIALRYAIPLQSQFYTRNATTGTPDREPGG
jgi:hypothetical protein